MSYNPDAQIIESQLVIDDTTPVGVTSGSIVNKGGLSTMDTFITGHAVINNVKITPNKNDIVYEQQAILSQSQSSFVDIEYFQFDSSMTNSFKAVINVNVSDAFSKFAVWEIMGLYKPDGWVISSSFTGDMTGVDFGIDEVAGICKVQYTNTNSSGTTTIRYRATTTAPPGSTPIDFSAGVINNTSGPFLPNNFIYANSPNTLASSDLTYNSNVFTIGGASRIQANNANNFTNYSNGGAITSMGDASIAKKLIVGDRIGVATTSPGYSIDIVGDINFTGNLYHNKSVYSGSSIWATNGNDVFYTGGNLGLGTTSPAYTLDVSGGARITTGISTGTIKATDVTFSNITTGSVVSIDLSNTNASISNAHITNSTISNGTIGNFVSTNASITNITSSSIVSDMITTTNAVVTNASVSNAVLTSLNSNIAHFTNITSSGLLVVNAVATNASVGTITSTNISSTNFTNTNLSTGTLNATSGVFTNLSSGNFSGSTMSAGTLSLSGDLFVAGTLTTVNITSQNLVNTNVSAGYVFAGTSFAAVGNSNTLGSIFTTAGNVGIGNASPNAKLDVSGTAYFSSGITAGSSGFTSISSGNVNTLNSTITNLVGTNMSGSNVNITNLTSAIATITDGVFTNASVGTLTVTNVVSSGISSANARITTITAGSIIATGISTSNILTSNNTATNSLITNASVGTLNATGITAANINFTGSLYKNGEIYISSQWTTDTENDTLFYTGGNVGISTTSPAYTLDVNGSGRFTGTLIAGDSSFSSITSSSLIATTSISTASLGAANGIFTNVTSSNAAISALVSSNISSTNVTSVSLNVTNVNASNITTATLVANTSITAPIVSGTNSTMTNIVNTNFSSGTAFVTNIVNTVSTVGTLLVTNIRGTSSTVTNVNATGITSGSINANNIVSSSGITSGSINVTSLNSTNSSIGTFTSLAGTIGGSLTPSTTLLYDLGTASLRWKDLYMSGNTIYMGDKQLSLTDDKFTVEKLNATSTAGSTSTTTGALIVNGGAGIAENLNIGGDITAFTNADSVRGLTINNTNTGAAARSNINVGAGQIYTMSSGDTALTIRSISQNSSGITLLTANTGANIYVSTARVGINTASPSATLDVSGTAKITTSLTTGAVYATNITATNMAATSMTTGTINATGLSTLTNVVATNGTVGVLVATTGLTTGTINATGLTTLTNTTITNVSASNIIGTTVSASTLVGTTITGGNLSLSGNLFVGGTLTTVNITSTNFVDTNLSAGTMNVSGLSSLTALAVSGTSTLANLFVPGAFSAPNAYVTLYGLTASTNITTGAVYATSSTITNIVSTNMTSATLNLTTGVTTASAQITNANVTTSTIATLLNTNVASTNMTSATLNLTTGVTAASAQITNANVTTSTIATLLNTNVVSTNMTSATLNLSTGVTAASARITGVLQAINNSNTIGSIYTTGGNVGVNTVAPNTYLQIAGTASTYGHLFINDPNPTIWGGSIGGSAATLTLKAGYGAGGETDSQRSKFQINAWNADTNIGNSFVFKTSGDTERMRIINSGNVGIGTGTPSATLHVVGQAIVNNASVATPTLTTLGGTGTKIQIGDGSGSALPYAIGVETANMWFSSGNGFKWYGGSSTQASMQLTSSNLVVTGDMVAFGSISDRRLKENIQGIDVQLALDTVKTLRPVTFDWRQDIFNEEHRGQSDVGFIAQEVAEVIPEAVSEFNEINSGITYKNMRHERIIPYLVGSIQRLEELLAEYKLRIEDLEKK
jgi:hypothetical protein